MLIKETYRFVIDIDVPSSSNDETYVAINRIYPQGKLDKDYISVRGKKADEIYEFITNAMNE